MCIFGGGGGARAAEKLQQTQANEVRSDADEKAGKLREGNAAIDNAFSGFNDDYFSKLQRDYTDYAMPQYQDQYNDAKNNIVFSLARHGNINSTVAGDQYADLDKEAAKAMVGIQGTGADIANSARRDVQADKQDVIGQLNTSYDVGSATDSALSAAKALAVPKSFSPLGQLFTNISAVAAQNKLASTGNPELYGNYGARNYGGASGSGVTVN
jgi:hypothetical protein